MKNFKSILLLFFLLLPFLQSQAQQVVDSILTVDADSGYVIASNPFTKDVVIDRGKIKSPFAFRFKPAILSSKDVLSIEFLATDGQKTNNFIEKTDPYSLFGDRLKNGIRNYTPATNFFNWEDSSWIDLSVTMNLATQVRKVSNRIIFRNPEPPKPKYLMRQFLVTAIYDEAGNQVGLRVNNWPEMLVFSPDIQAELLQVQPIEEEKGR